MTPTSICMCTVEYGDKMVISSVSVPMRSLRCLLPLQELIQGKQVSLTSVAFKLLTLPWNSEQVSFCPLKAEAHFPTGLGLLQCKPSQCSKSDVLRASLPGAGPPG